MGGYIRSHHEAAGAPIEPPALPQNSILDATAVILKRVDRSLHSREIAALIMEGAHAQLSGKTPWKTVTARLSNDIVQHGGNSRFMRTAHGLFALREWEFATEFEVRRRKLHPIDEIIRAVPRERFLEYIRGHQEGALYKCPFEELVDLSGELHRRDAEVTEAVVQLIPTFVVRRKRKILTYVRTKRLPEARLHHARCVSFGGHMEASDDLSLFRSEELYKDSVLRELYEELSFSKPPQIRYLGILYLQGNMFERQHAGLVFDVSLGQGTNIASLEPGMHVDVRLTDIKDIIASANDLDSWSRVLLEVANELSR